MRSRLNSARPIIAGVIIAFAMASCSPETTTLDDEVASDIDPVKNPGKSADAKSYIGQHLEVYDVKGAYTNSLLDGRVPGLTLKIKNNGKRTLERVEIRAVFKDGEGNPIAEDTFMPVLTTGFDNDPPLRPGYIWQNERGTFFAAKSVPSEWDGSSVDVEVIDIEFGDED